MDDKKEIFFYRNIRHYEYGEKFFGSHRGKRFCIARNPLTDVHLEKDKKNEEAKLEITIWPEPYCMEKTEDNLKTVQCFDFSQEGLTQADSWLEEMLG